MAAVKSFLMISLVLAVFMAAAAPSSKALLLPNLLNVPDVVSVVLTEIQCTVNGLPLVGGGVRPLLSDGLVQVILNGTLLAQGVTNSLGSAIIPLNLTAISELLNLDGGALNLNSILQTVLNNAIVQIVAPVPACNSLIPNVNLTSTLQPVTGLIGGVLNLLSVIPVLFGGVASSLKGARARAERNQKKGTTTTTK